MDEKKKPFFLYAFVKEMDWKDNCDVMRKRIADNDIEFLLCELRALFLKKKVVKFLSKCSTEQEKKEILEYLSVNRLSVFPYDFKNNYNANNVEVHKNHNNGLLYTMCDKHKVYFKRKYKSAYRAKRYYNNLLIEQDPASPHCYTTTKFKPERGDVLLDIGGAEGFFAMKYLNVVKKVYVFECDKGWAEALRTTFKNYENKVCVIEKAVSDINDATHISIDEFVKKEKLEDENLFIKMDVEGHEAMVVRGARNTLKHSRNIRLDICTYHCGNHETMFRKLFRNWSVENSEGYMIYYYDRLLRAPYVRRGVLRIKKKDGFEYEG